MKLSNKLLIIIVALFYSTFLFGCNSRSDFAPYADGTYTAEDEHHHHHDDEDEHDHDHEHEGEDNEHENDDHEE